MAGFGQPVSGVAPLCFGETRKYICMHLAFCETEELCVSVLPTSLLRRFAANLNGVRSMATRARGPRCSRSENRVFQTISSFAGSTVNQRFFLWFRFSSILSFFIGKHVSPSIVFVFAKQASISAIREPVSPSYLYKTSWTSDVFLLSFRIRKSYRCLTNNCISLNGNVVVSPLYFQLAREFRFIAVETWSVVYVRICDSASSSRKISSNTIVSLNDWISRKGDSVTACINIDHSVSWREAVPILLI